ncbi:hypothetical protein L202_02016 [Cryptococcus amylolentus CBS 6039]|uniref:SCP domain-containing protein n=1 Tax=Cryptococcus amylolentus CBS 6039 TaxID=1295533 RepID=A0A1E3HZB7_9TREE|nr:hypothetical protein L202_02016 [Cryptococcus amylolentus CBS 6039]ODN81607.1 hypothetical protein L202_02016 [Cryptococcus amylolentus CBS 6039]
MLLTNLFALLPLLALASARPYDDKLHRRQCTAHRNHKFSAHGNGTLDGQGSAVAAVVVPASSTASLEQETQTATFISSSTEVQETATPVSSTSEQEATTTSSSSPEETATSASFSVSAEASSTGSSSGLSTDAQTLVDLYNAFRAQYGAGNVTWNDDLASYAATAAAKCDMQHTGGPYGENLASGVGGGYDITAGFQSWADEACKLTFALFRAGLNVLLLMSYHIASYNGSASHFTQVVWKATSEIGCATSSCADGTIFTGYGSNLLYLVCEYNPAGNVIGDFAANVGA